MPKYFSPDEIGLFMFDERVNECTVRLINWTNFKPIIFGSIGLNGYTNKWEVKFFTGKRQLESSVEVDQLSRRRAY